MKLQTMILPTGEFILIASGASKPLPSELATKFRKQTGAVALFQTETDPVEVVNAAIDENAVRHEEKVATAPQLDGSFKMFMPRADLNGQTVALEFTATPTPDFVKNVYGVDPAREYSPGGLIKGRPGDPDFLRDPQFAQGGEPGADPEPELVISNPIETVEPEPYKPQLGDRVRIDMINGGNGRPQYRAYEGAIGEIVSIDGDRVYVEVPGLGWPGIWAAEYTLVEPAKPSTAELVNTLISYTAPGPTTPADELALAGLAGELDKTRQLLEDQKPETD